MSDHMSSYSICVAITDQSGSMVKEELYSLTIGNIQECGTASNGLALVRVLRWKSCIDHMLMQQKTQTLSF